VQLKLPAIAEGVPLTDIMKMEQVSVRKPRNLNRLLSTLGIVVFIAALA